MKSNWILALVLVMASSVVGANCPQTGEEWTNWRTSKVRLLNQELRAYYADTRAPASALRENYQAIKEELSKCVPHSAKVAECLAPFSAHVNAFSELFSLSDLRGDPDTEGKEIPEWLRAPSFLNALEKSKTITPAGAAKAAALLPRHLNHAFYQGFSFAGIARDSNRWLIEVPGEKKHWVLLSKLPAPGNALASVDGEYLRVTSIQEYKTADGKSSIHFGSDWNVHQGIQLEGPASQCFMCHRNGLLPIRLANERETTPAVERLNASLLNSSARMPLADKVTALGPSLGAALEDPVWNRRFAKACSKDFGLAEGSSEKIQAAGQSCIGCHQGGKPIPVIPFWNGNLKRYLTHGHMPPKLTVALSQTERAALFACLRQNYLDDYADENGKVWPGQWSRYFTQNSCLDAPPTEGSRRVPSPRGEHAPRARPAPR